MAFSFDPYKPIDFSVVALLREDGYILLQLRDNKPEIVCPDQWALPGGGVEPNEDPEKAAERELLEETGYNATGKLTFISFIYHRLPNGYLKKGSLYYSMYDHMQPLHCFEGQKLEFINILAVHSYIDRVEITT